MEEIPDEIHRDHLGVHRQKQIELYYIGASVLRGRITPAQLRNVGELAEIDRDGHVRLTVQQNILLISISEARVNQVINELNQAGLPVAVSAFARGTVACTGSEFCKLALTETKGFARWHSRELEERFTGFEEQIKLHITG